MAADGYVTIHRTTDAAQGELLAETLRSDGIDARFHRVSSALIGVPTSMIEMTVDVPIESEARARELLRDLEYVGADAAAKPAVGEGEDGDAEPEGTRRPLRNPVMAAGFAFFVPGGGHLNARRPWTTLVLAAGVVGWFAVAMATRSAVVFEFVVAILIATVACDAGVAQACKPAPHFGTIARFSIPKLDATPAPFSG